MQRIGIAVAALGVVSVVFGLATNDSGDGAEDAAQATTTAEPTTTTLAPTTTEPTTTSTATTSTTTTSTTTTTTTTTTLAPVPGPEEVDGFVQEMAAAIAAGDVAFLLDRLHPVAIGLRDEETCRAFIEAEILLLEDYRVVGTVETTSQVYAVGDANVTVDPLFLAPVAFNFRGQSFDATSNFAPEDGLMRWFTPCE